MPTQEILDWLTQPVVTGIFGWAVGGVLGWLGRHRWEVRSDTRNRVKDFRISVEKTRRLAGLDCYNAEGSERLTKALNELGLQYQITCPHLRKKTVKLASDWIEAAGKLSFHGYQMQQWPNGSDLAVHHVTEAEGVLPTVRESGSKLSAALVSEEVRLFIMRPRGKPAY